MKYGRCVQVASLLQDISAATQPYPPAHCLEQGHDGYPVYFSTFLPSLPEHLTMGMMDIPLDLPCV